MKLSQLAGVLATWLCLVATATARDSQPDRRLEALVEEIKVLQQNLQDAALEKKDLGSRLQKIERESADTRKRIFKSESEIRRLDGELSRLGERKRQLDESLRRQQDFIKRDLASAYKLGRQEQMKLLLNQENPQLFNRVLKYYDYFLAARRTRVDQFRATLVELEQLTASISAKRTDLDRQKNQLSEQQRQLGEEKSDRRQTLARLNRQISDGRQQLDKLSKERSVLEELLKAVEKAIDNIRIPGDNLPLEKLRGKLHWPVDGRVKQRFGQPRTGDLRWEGWLLTAKEGTFVKAVHHGRVVFSDYLRGQGLLIILDHGNNYLSLYAHNQMLLKEPGDWVTANEAIARVGNTGGLSENALYFEIRHNGKPANPAAWLTSTK